MTVDQPQYRHHDRSDAMALDELALSLFDRMPKPQPVPELEDARRFGAYADVWGDAR